MACSQQEFQSKQMKMAVPMLDPSDLPGIRQTMTDMLRDESVRGDVVRAGQKRVALYTWKRCAERTCQIYGECA